MPPDDRPTLAAPDDDPYLWLEDVEGARALEFVEAQNRRTLAEFGSTTFAADRDALAAIYDRPDNIPYVTRNGGHLYQSLEGRQQSTRRLAAHDAGILPQAKAPTGKSCSTSTSLLRTKMPTGC